MKAPLDLSAHGSFQVEFAPIVPADSGITDLPGSTSIRPNEVPSLGEQVINRSTKPSDHVSEFMADARERALLPISMNATIAGMINNSLQSGFLNPDAQPSSGAASWSSTPFWHFSESHLEIVARFHSRTAMTIGNKQLAPAYRDITCQLAFTVRLFSLDQLVHDHPASTINGSISNDRNSIHSSCICFSA